MPTPAEIGDEDRRLAELQGLVERAEDVIAGLRQDAERLFPGQKRSFELIYKPRLLRAATQQ